jgi:prolipoprotein diacylglyceryltransferase
LEIDPQYRPAGYASFATFHPTFLYELLWNLAVAVALVLLDRRFRLGHGKVFALYVALYSAGRFWIEALRIDAVTEIGGFRLNNYTSAVTFVVSVAVLVWLVRNRPGREAVVEGPEVRAVGTEATSGPAEPADPADQAADADPTTTPPTSTGPGRDPAP